MNLPAKLQEAIAQVAKQQGISAEQFIVQTLVEKIDTLQQTSEHSKDEDSEASSKTPQLVEKNGILVLKTVPLGHINFNQLIDQLRTERDEAQMQL
ncbi:MAG: hypothetical protein AAFY26_06515 [Cyanobacteria bacterium J06638_22]